MKILSEQIDTELRFKGSTGEIREIIEKLTEKEKREKNKDLKEEAKGFLTNVFGRFEDLDDTKPIFTAQDIADMLDDFTDWVEGASWEEIAEKNKKRRIARLAQNPKRGLY